MKVNFLHTHFDFFLANLGKIPSRYCSNGKTMSRRIVCYVKINIKQQQSRIQYFSTQYYFVSDIYISRILYPRTISVVLCLTLAFAQHGCHYLVRTINGAALRCVAADTGHIRLRKGRENIARPTDCKNESFSSLIGSIINEAKLLALRNVDARCFCYVCAEALLPPNLLRRRISS